jgi:hypothetical protein
VSSSNSKEQRQRPYVVTTTTVSNPTNGTASNALTRDAIRLEIAMRLTIKHKKVKEAWLIADEFVEEMDNHLSDQ